MANPTTDTKKQAPVAAPKTPSKQAATPRSLKDLTEWEQGKKTLADVFEVSSANLEGIAVLGLAYYREEDYPSTIKVFEGLRSFGFDIARFLPTLGSAYQLTDQTEKAVRTYIEALKHTPDDLYVLTNLGELLLNRGRMNDAAELFKKVIALDPKQAHPAGVRARALIVKGVRQTKGKR
jgi:tetratricopeptide (TPR) repeat protein